MKKYVLILFLLFNEMQAKSGFEIFGDVAQITPFVVSTALYFNDDKLGAGQNAISTLSTLAITHIIKQGFVILSRSDKKSAAISARPSPYNESYNGMPSGHTSFVFSSVGFAQKRYGAKVSIPLGVIGTLVGASRIHADKHTALQVVIGAALGFTLGYTLSSNKESNLAIVPNFSKDSKNGSMVGLNIHGRF